MTATDLTPAESTVLSTYEAIIKKGLNSFIEVGSALMRIRDGKLYRETFANFEDYCREKWQIGRDRAEQLCKAASIVETLPTNVGKPKKESQARELSKIDDPAVRAEVWEEAVAEASKGEEGERQPTAKQLKAAASRRSEESADATHRQSEARAPSATPPKWWRETLASNSSNFDRVKKFSPEGKTTDGLLNAIEQVERWLEKVKKEIV